MFASTPKPVLLGLFLLALAAFMGSLPVAAEDVQRSLVLERVEVHPPGGAVERAVERLLQLRAGDALGAESLGQASQQLRSTGYFDSLRVYAAPGSRPGAVVLVVEGVLDRSAHFETGFGYDPLDSWALDVAGVRWNNAFGSFGHLSLGFSTGLRTGGLQAQWYRPAPLASGLDLHLRGFVGAEHWLVYDSETQFRQQLDRSRLELGLAAPSARRLGASLWLGVSAVEADSTLEEFGGDATLARAGFLPELAQRQEQSYVRLDLEWDGRDDGLEPRRGLWLGSRVQGALVKGRPGYWKARLGMRVFAAGPGRSSLALRLRGEMADPLTPYYERIVFGGVGSVRGFRDASLSGGRGARGAWLTSAEFRAPLLGRQSPRPRLSGVLFADLGRSWDADGERGELSAGVGYGLRLRIPWVQIFSLDVGIPLTPDLTGDPFWIHLSLGQSF